MSITYLFYRLLTKLAARTKMRIDGRIVKAMKHLAFLVVLLACLRTFLPMLELPYYSKEAG
ncbi:MAG: hypothetical protein QXQ28_06550 [Candidatus Nezhaarchaeales archaeon]